jgi:thiol:disulfide interchange protein DsbC
MKTERLPAGRIPAWALGLSAILATGTTAADEAAIRHSMSRLLPDLKVERVEPSPVSGLYEVVIGPRLFYMSADGRYLLQGSVLDLQTHENITESKLDKTRKAALDKVPEDEMIIFSPEHPKHTISVFTDIDCGYCRKLHQQIGDFMQEGIRVRYLFFPRAGLGSPSYDKAVTVWCSTDRKQALTDAKAGKTLAPLSCDNPVKEQMMLGELMGVTGTPAIVLEDGRLLPGYVPPKRMAMYLEGQGN